MNRRSHAVLIMWLVGLLLVAASTVFPVAAGSPPVAAFTHSPEEPLINQNVVFNASTSYDPDGYPLISYRWDFGEGAPIIISDPVTYHNYTIEGSYNVTLTVTDQEGLNATAWHIVTVEKHPVASFTWSPAYPLVGQLVTFNASLSTPNGGAIVNYTWAFGDTNVTTVTYPVLNHVYAAVGNYTVSLTVADSEGLTDAHAETVRVRQFPTASFTWSPAYPLVNQTVTFNASLSTPDGGTIANYTWNFDDANVTTVTNPVINHVYTAFGTYNVTLTVTDSEGLSDAFWDTVRILIAPVAKFTYSPSTPIVNQMVTLNASASYDPDFTIVGYAWNFGDGNTGAGMVATHPYAAAGTYNVTLTVTDDDGLTDKVSKLIVVYTFLYRHDVAIVSVTSALPYGATAVYPQGGWHVNVTVVARNEGNATESFSVTVYYGNTTIGTQPVSNLNPGADTTLTFTWNVTGVPPCKYKFITNVSDPLYPGYYIPYTLSASASRVPGETDADAADNLMLDGNVTVRLPGDASGDGRATGSDLAILGRSWWKSYPNSGYDWRADWNGDGRCTGSDLAILGRNWYQSAPPAPDP